MKFTMFIALWLVPTLIAFAQDANSHSDNPKAQITLQGTVMDAATKQPLAGVRVVYLRMDGRQVVSGRDFDVAPGRAEEQDPAAMSMAVLTDAGGNFQFRVNAPVEYRLRADCAGYVTYASGQEKAESSPKATSIALVRESTISGRVIDADTGEPVAGIGVGVNGTTAPGGLAGLTLYSGNTSTTDAEGRFLIKRLQPGDYLVQVAPPLAAKLGKRTDDPEFRDRVNRNYGRSWYPGVEQMEQAGRVTVVPGASIDWIEIPIKKVRTFAVRGRIFSPVEGAVVSVDLSHVQFSRLAKALGIIARGELEPGEGFEVDNLLPGQYWLSASVRREDGSWYKGGVLVEVNSKNLDEINVQLASGVTVSGQVRIAGSESDRLPGGQMTLDLTPTQHFRELPLTRSNAESDGGFSLDHVMVDQYQVNVSGQPVGFKVSEVRYNGRIAPYGVVDLDAGAEVQRLVVELAPARGSVTVTVMDGTRPASGAWVLLAADPVDEAGVEHALRRGRTDGDGRVSITELLPGAYRVLAVQGEEWATDPLLSLRLQRGKKVEVKEAGGTELELRVERR